jgi:hypothetical protein
VSATAGPSVPWPLWLGVGAASVALMVAASTLTEGLAQRVLLISFLLLPFVIVRVYELAAQKDSLGTIRDVRFAGWLAFLALVAWWVASGGLEASTWLLVAAIVGATVAELPTGMRRTRKRKHDQ